MERERDKERLESKRKLELLKKTIEEEQDENKKKLIEVKYVYKFSILVFL